MAGPYAICYGDSIGDATTPAYGSGIWFDQVCTHFGWTRRGGGASSGDYSRAAIAGVAIQPLGIPTHAYDGVAARLAPSMMPGAPNYVFFELGTNDYFGCSAFFDVVSLGNYIDLMMATVLAMAVQPTMLAWVGMTNQPRMGINPVGGTPPWATSAADAWTKLDNVARAKALQYGMAYVDLSGMPVGLLPDGTHPASAVATAYYANQVIATLAPLLSPSRADPYWECTFKFTHPAA